MIYTPKRKKYRLHRTSGAGILILIIVGLMAGWIMIEAAKADPVSVIPEVPTAHAQVITPAPVMSVEDQIIEVAKNMNYQAPLFLVRLARCESTLDPNRDNTKSGARGLFQIMPSHLDVTDECSHDVTCSTTWTIQQLLKGRAGWWECTAIIS